MGDPRGGTQKNRRKSKKKKTESKKAERLCVLEFFQEFFLTFLTFFLDEKSRSRL